MEGDSFISPWRGEMTALTVSELPWTDTLSILGFGTLLKGTATVLQKIFHHLSGQQPSFLWDFSTGGWMRV